MKLLVVDDSNVIRRAITRMVGADFEIFTANDGLQALAAFDQHKPEAVTMDLTMPHLDGLACIRQMLKREPATRILVISALADQTTAIEAVELGAQGFLLKPITETKLKEEIKELLAD